MFLLETNTKLHYSGIKFANRLFINQKTTIPEYEKHITCNFIFGPSIG